MTSYAVGGELGGTILATSCINKRFQNPEKKCFFEITIPVAVPSYCGSYKQILNLGGNSNNLRNLKKYNLSGKFMKFQEHRKNQ